MREIIQVQIGQCGNQIGGRFWNDILEEHGIDKDGYKLKSTQSKSKADDARHQCLDVYFDQMDDDRYIPRTLLVDMEPSIIENLKAGPLGSLFAPSSLIYQYSGAGNNWAKGHYTYGSEMLEGVCDLMRQKAETCESLQGFQFVYSLGGGTGSGFGSLLLSRLREDYNDRIMTNFSIFPSASISNTVVEPYNAVLASSYLIQNSDAVQVSDNEALGNIAIKSMELAYPTFDHFNQIVAQVMNGVTCTLRFPGQLNSDLRKFCVNLVPFPRLHFLTCSTAPLKPIASNDNGSEKLEVCLHNITKNLQDPNYFTCRHKNFVTRNFADRLLTASVIYRGTLSTKCVDEQLRAILNKQALQFVDWIPNCIKSCVCPVGVNKQKLSATLLANSTNVKYVFEDIRERFSLMLQKRAFLHWYTAEGLDEMEFYEAENDVADLINEYHQHKSYSAPTPDEQSKAAYVRPTTPTKLDRVSTELPVKS